MAELEKIISVLEELHSDPFFKRENKIKTIHSSFMVEQNIPTLEQVTDVINGKRISSPLKDIKTVWKNCRKRKKYN